ncbi:MAG: hypothetical protein GF335_04365 [Candidatus Moranbacteria bacterium]|nr:hypothetical protein [Candidatus Moranbacteria bacterium]
MKIKFIAAKLLNLYNPLAPVTGGGDPKKMLVNFVGQILGILMGVVVGIALIFIILGGILYMLSSGVEEKMTQARKMITYAVIGIAITIGAAVLLSEISIALTGQSVLSTTFTITPKIQELIKTPGDGMKTIVENIINLLLTLLAMFGVIGIIIGGLWYLNSGGDEEKATIGKKTLIYSIIGLFVAIGSQILVKQIAAFFQ